MRINTGCWVDGCKCFDSDDEDGVEIKKDREWVGLTEQEQSDIAWQKDMSRLWIVTATEAKLKEKNNGNN